MMTRTRQRPKKGKPFFGACGGGACIVEDGQEKEGMEAAAAAGIAYLSCLMCCLITVLRMCGF